MSEQTPHLEPCPRCGKPPQYDPPKDENDQPFIHCLTVWDFGAEGAFECGVYSQSVKAWNTRADLAQSQIKAAEAAALRRAAEALVDVIKSSIAEIDQDDGAKEAWGKFPMSLLSLTAKRLEIIILALISDDQQSILDAYVKAKVGEALDRADAEIKAAVLILVRAVDLGVFGGNKTANALDLLRAKFSPDEIATGVLTPSEQ